MTLHIGHPEPPCYPRGVNMMGISDASIIHRSKCLKLNSDHPWNIVGMYESPFQTLLTHIGA